MFLQIDNYLTPAEVQDIAELARGKAGRLIGGLRQGLVLLAVAPALHDALRKTDRSGDKN